jgi:hypothetical protein
MNSTTQNVAYVLAAEFDIDRGSCLRHAIPCVPPGYDEQYGLLIFSFRSRLVSELTAFFSSILAELMLPDGAHNRSEDWTMFFLNREMPKRSKPITPQPRKQKAISISVLRFNDTAQGTPFSGIFVYQSHFLVCRMANDGWAGLLRGSVG